MALVQPGTAPPAQTLVVHCMQLQKCPRQRRLWRSMVLEELTDGQHILIQRTHRCCRQPIQLATTHRVSTTRIGNHGMARRGRRHHALRFTRSQFGLRTGQVPVPKGIQALGLKCLPTTHTRGAEIRKHGRPGVPTSQPGRCPTASGEVGPKAAGLNPTQQPSR